VYFGTAHGGAAPPFLSLIPRKRKEDAIDFTSSSVLLLASSGKMGGALLIA
jgi:hypothetical protein